MTVANWVALVVAVVAALASLTGALLARRSATAAHNSADSIDRRRHMIDAIDHEMQTFQAAYGDFARAVIPMRDDLDSAEREIRLREILVCTGLLRIHPRTSGDLRTVATDAATGVTMLQNAPDEVRKFGAQILVAEFAARQILGTMAQERRDLVAGLHDGTR